MGIAVSPPAADPAATAHKVTFAQLAAAYRAKHRVDPKDLKRAMAHISVKSHDNGAKNPKAHLRNRITEEDVLNAPMIADPLGLYDCCGVSDGSACAIVTTPDIARGLGKKDLVAVKALQLAVSNGQEAQFDGWDGSYFATTRAAAARAYKEADIADPRKRVSIACSAVGCPTPYPTLRCSRTAT